MTQHKKKSPRSPTPVDSIIAENLFIFRHLRGYSQENLAEQLGVTFQQLQKYEKGNNRVAASRLFHISQLLQIPITDFFKGLPEFPKSSEEKLLTQETIQILALYDALGTQDKKDTAKAVIKSLR